MRSRRLYLAIAFILSCLWNYAYSINHFYGLVVDSISMQPIPKASIVTLRDNRPVIVNEDGRFECLSNEDSVVIQISAVSYKPKTVTLYHIDGVQVIRMELSYIELEEVVVKPQKRKYNKRNPAVELIAKVRSNNELTNPKKATNYSFRKHEYISMGFNDIDNSEDKKNLLSKYGFLKSFSDTLLLSEKHVLPLSVKEKLSNEYYRNNPFIHKEVVSAIRNYGLDYVLDQSSVKDIIDELFHEIDIYNNDIVLLSNHFVSPLSSIAPDFYKYYITDTIKENQSILIELSFLPHNSESFGFFGKLYVGQMDSMFYVSKAILNLPRKTNINYVQSIRIEQQYTFDIKNHRRIKDYDYLEVELKVTKNTTGFYALRQTTYDEHSFALSNELNLIAKEPQEIIILEDAMSHSQDYWQNNRLSKNVYDANNVEKMLARLRQEKWFYWGEKVISLFSKNFIPTSSQSKWDIGPISSIISSNDLEGVRLRLGGMTTTKLSQHWFNCSYFAYGTKDHKFKYGLMFEYSFPSKQDWDTEFPIHSISISHKYDLFFLGQNFLSTNNENLVFSITRQKNDKALYNRETELNWTYENQHNFMTSVSLLCQRREQTKAILLEKQDRNISQYNLSGFVFKLRYAPGEKFYQNRLRRVPIRLEAPVFTISQTIMPKGFLGGNFSVIKTEASFQKRFWFSAFGYADILLSGGKVWSVSPFPELFIPNANLSYMIQNETFDLMNAMEFIADGYFSWHTTYWGNGVVFNYIPFIKRLKLREVLTFKGILGHLSKRNYPNMDNSLLAFPGNMCNALGSKPYMEIGVGIDNILTVLRVDYVWRLSYKNHVGINTSGLRVQLHFNF